MARKRFTDRADAGRHLAERMGEVALGDDVLALGVTREGVPVAAALAGPIGAELDVFLVRRLFPPGDDAAAFGVIATGGARVLNDEVLDGLSLSAEQIDEIETREREELERAERALRGDAPPPRLAGRTIVLVDDGLGTGLNMFAALQAARAEGPERIVVAVPVAAPDVADALGIHADAAVCLHTPATLVSIGDWYEDFPVVTDDEVRELLEHARTP
jgi:predicted phosphoribosyltransferase